MTPYSNIVSNKYDIMGVGYNDKEKLTMLIFNLGYNDARYINAKYHILYLKNVEKSLVMSMIHGKDLDTFHKNMINCKYEIYGWDYCN